MVFVKCSVEHGWALFIWNENKKWIKYIKFKEFKELNKYTIIQSKN